MNKATQKMSKHNNIDLNFSYVREKQFEIYENNLYVFFSFAQFVCVYDKTKGLFNGSTKKKQIKVYENKNQEK